MIWHKSDFYPDDSRQILITDGRTIMVGMYMPRGNFGYVTRTSTRKNQCVLSSCDNITHWMELPDLPPNVRDHRAGLSDQGKAEKIIVAGSGASTCWADLPKDGEK